jgi:hypothetical protein
MVGEMVRLREEGPSLYSRDLAHMRVRHVHDDCQNVEVSDIHCPGGRHDCNDCNRAHVSEFNEVFSTCGPATKVLSEGSSIKLSLVNPLLMFVRGGAFTLASALP